MRFGYGLEIGGNNTLVEGNTVQGLWTNGISIGKAPYATVRNNYLCGSAGAMSIFFEAGPQPGVTTTPNTKAALCEQLAIPTVGIK